MHNIRKLTTANKLKIAERQHFKCANSPDSNLIGIQDYRCHLWTNKENSCSGIFDLAGYEIDHVIPHCISQDDSESNLQALCPPCHKVKTKMTPKKFWVNASDVNGNYEVVQITHNDVTYFGNNLNKPKPAPAAKLTYSQLFDEMIKLRNTDFNIQDILAKQKNTPLTASEDILAKLYHHLNIFGLADTITDVELKKHLEKFYGKEQIVHNFEVLFQYKPIYMDGKDNIRVNIIIDLLNRLLGVNKNNYCLDDIHNAFIPAIDFSVRLNDIIMNSKFFKNELGYRALFFKSGMLKKDFPSNKSQKSIQADMERHYISTMQKMLELFGISLKSNGRIQINGKRYHSYIFSIDDQIKNIVIAKNS